METAVLRAVVRLLSVFFLRGFLTAPLKYAIIKLHRLHLSGDSIRMQLRDFDRRMILITA